MQLKPFKVLNKYNSEYHAVSPLEVSRYPPTQGKDRNSERKTLKFNGGQYLSCPMDWSSNDGYADNLQVFIVFKYNKNPRVIHYKYGIVGNDNGGNKRFVAINDDKLEVGGATINPLIIKKYAITILR